MPLTIELDRQSIALIQECRQLLGVAMKTDPDTYSLSPEKLIVTLELMSLQARRIARQAAGIRSNAVTLSRRRRRRLAVTQ